MVASPSAQPRPRRRTRAGFGAAIAVAAAVTAIGPAAAPASAATVANQVLTLVNRERSKAGCRPLVLDSRLQGAAKLHSQDMASRNYFSHTSRNGRTFVQRIRAKNYNGLRLGENIAAGQPNTTSVVSAWMKSPGHRANILNCRYASMGVNYARGGHYGIYWTQDFGAAR